MLAGLPGSFVLGASRFVSYKRLDAAIAVGEDLGLPVVLAGRGPERAALEAAGRGARVPVTIIDSPSTPLLYALYEAATLFVFAPVETRDHAGRGDGYGTPVLVNVLGGASEAVALIGGGVATEFEDTHARRAAVDAALRLDGPAMRTAACALDVANFSERVREWVAS